MQAYVTVVILYRFEYTNRSVCIMDKHPKPLNIAIKMIVATVIMYDRKHTSPIEYITTRYVENMCISTCTQSVVDKVKAYALFRKFDH